MNDCIQIHETVIKDIIDVINGIKDFDGIETLRKKNNTGSIARRTSNLVIVFPALVSTTNTIGSSMLVAKALEKKCVMLLQILFASVQVSDSANLNDYIKQFHTNLNSKMNLDDFLAFMDRLVTESGAVTITDADAYEAVKKDMKNINFNISHNFNDTSLSDYSVSKNMMNENIVYKETKALNEAPLPEEIPSKDTIEYLKYLNNTITPMDIKKANELMPTIMHVNFSTTKDGVNTPIKIEDAVIGVKVKMYPVDSIDIINRITSKVKDKNGLFNLVRASTREISFFKDLAFAIDQIKVDAINAGSDSNNAKMFRLLERRANKNKFLSLIKRNDASPITSLILSQNDVEYILKYHNIDIRKPYITRSIMESFNLMNITILDESLEIARFLYDDGDGTFETLTFDALEKESNDNSYKKVINLMSKIAR